MSSLIGGSSLGRLGLFVQISADLGQIGTCRRWTLKIDALGAGYDLRRRCRMPLHNGLHGPSR